MDYLPSILFLLLIFNFPKRFLFHKKGSDKVSDNVGDIIWNGEDATQGQFKFMVSMQILRPKRHKYCGGAIIAPKWVITCAHCRNDSFSLEDYGIEAGSVNLFEGYLYNVARYIIHPKYEIELHYDIGLIEIKGEFDFRNPNIEPIELYNYPDIPIAEQITAIGWGMNQNFEYPENLQYQTHLFTDICYDLDFEGYDDKLICISHKSHYTTCFADSGGPCMYNNQLAGVVNGGGYPCHDGTQNAFARVYYHKRWILKYVKNDNIFV